MKKTILLLMLMSLTTITHAYRESYTSPWTVEAALGMGFYSKRALDSSQTAVGRLDIAYTLFRQPYWTAAIEAGIQSGNTLRLAIPKASIDALGGVPIEAQIKPILDVLIDLKTGPLVDTPMIVWFKGGVAYRQLIVNHAEVNNLSAVSPELQLGLGYSINDQLTLNLGYQVIWGRAPEVSVNPMIETGLLSYLPMQQGVMVGFSFGFL